MHPYTAEFIGTAILIILGGGVNANVSLSKTYGNGSGWIVISAGWGMAVTIAVYAVGHVSGAHINPAVTLGLASTGTWNPGVFEAGDVVWFIGAQVAGAFVGATIVWLAYLAHFKATEDPGTKLGVFSTGPAVPNTLANVLTELIGTALLVFGVLAIGHEGNFAAAGGDGVDAGWATGFKPLLVGLLVFAIGLSLGGPTGYAINPARDLGPRIAHAVLPIPGKGDSNWGYAWLPVSAPIAGGTIGALLFNVLF
jgi:glycerol uptake facilitator protein